MRRSEDNEAVARRRMRERWGGEEGTGGNGGGSYHISIITERGDIRNETVRVEIPKSINQLQKTVVKKGKEDQMIMG